MAHQTKTPEGCLRASDRRCHSVQREAPELSKSARSVGTFEPSGRLLVFPGQPLSDRSDLIPQLEAALDLLVEKAWHPVFFFPSSKSRTGHVGDPSAPWKRVLRHRGVDSRTRIHDIRHGFARAAYEACKDIECVAGLLGHLSSRTTSLYVGRLQPHVVAPTSQRAVESLLGELKEVSR